MCNGEDRTSPDPHVDGGAALIDSGEETPQVLAIAYNNRGNAYTAKGEYDLAIKDFEQAIKLNGDFTKAFNNRGVVYRKKGAFDRAIEDFNQAIKLDPNYASPFAKRAAIHASRGEHDRATRDYDWSDPARPSGGSSSLERTLLESRHSGCVAGGAIGLQ